ncbi:cell division suppressor protein YneA [Brevibacillus daliensis]|uniref:cell division suppressor protein YneA n=1 Tax=Brevibacillus daliensis TaxID=2892995 RepID=UPI001E43F49A|nr:LysM peptidoglycan-binding domain-containing protein [Brevibacillus daliensis]
MIISGQALNRNYEQNRKSNSHFTYPTRLELKKEHIHNRKQRGITRLHAIVFIILLSTLSFLTGSLVFAEKNTVIASGELLEITIQPGDTLWTIASEYHSQTDLTTQELVQEIQEINQLESPLIYAGNNLIIPVPNIE